MLLKHVAFNFGDSFLLNDLLPVRHHQLNVECEKVKDKKSKRILGGDFKKLYYVILYVYYIICFLHEFLEKRSP